MPTSPFADTAYLLRLIRDGRARTRGELADLSSLSRSTITQRVDQLIARSLVTVAPGDLSTGGRRPEVLLFNRAAAAVVAVDCGASRTHIAVADLAGTLLSDRSADINVAAGPDAVLSWVEGQTAGLLADAGVDPDSLAGFGIGLPGPVDHGTGRPVNPPIMPGWDRYPVQDRLQQRFGVAALVDNDVNVMALGEHRSAYPEVAHLLFVKVSTGIGCGIVVDGRIHRGAHGAAGDIGHIHVPGHDDVLCACGNHGCLEAVAGGGALAKRLPGTDPAADGVAQIVERVRGGDAGAARLVRNAGRELGEVLAMLVNAYDPELIIVGGRLADAERPLLAGAREVVYRRSLPLATHSLRIEPSRVGEPAGVLGAATLIVDHLVSTDGRLPPKGR